jgi:hypothetical protein
MKRALCAALAFVAVTSVGVDARATLEFAQVLMSEPYERSSDCRLCHAQSIGSAGTATQPFAKTLKRHGIGATSSASKLEAVLEQLDDEDSDGDGFTDLEELLTGGDPNVEGRAETREILVYHYGCANLVGTRPSRVWLGLVGLSIVSLWRRRRSSILD